MRILNTDARQHHLLFELNVGNRPVPLGRSHEVAVAVDLEPFEERLAELHKQSRTQRGIEARELFRRLPRPAL